MSRAAGRGRRSWATGLAALALLLTSAHVDWGTICYGEDGHVAVEPLLAGHCAAADRDAGGEQLASSPAVSAAAPCCGPCTDVPIASGAWLERSTAKGTVSSPPAQGVAHLPAWTPRAPRSLAPSSFAASTPLLHRTVPGDTVRRC